MKKALLAVAGLSLLLATVLLVRTASYSAPAPVDTTADTHAPDEQQIARHLSEAIRFRTISADMESASTRAQFAAFIEWLAATYPAIHTAMPPQQLGVDTEHPYTLLFTWPGQREDLAPILLSAHYDVVPVIPGTEGEWRHPPYGGIVDDTHIWGRGTLDDKGAAIALMEATTTLLEMGFQPQRTIYISLTSDEEIGGDHGTAAVVQNLQDEGIQLAWSLDEGSFLLDGFIPGVDQPVASINIAEKGYLTVDLVARGRGGHSSMPPRETAVDTLAAALVRLKQEPLPGGLEGVGAGMFDAVAPHMPFGKRLLFANRWLFGGLIESVLEDQPGTAAMLRTTTAPTMLSGSIKDNVLPIEAVATVNLRVHPRDTIDGIVKHLEQVIDDERVKVRVREGRSASRVSSKDAAGFQAIAAASRATYGPQVIAPGLTIGGTDSRRYEEVADNSYRFNPMVVTSEDTHGFHGTNERISIDNIVGATRFYRQLMEEAGNE
ncbi:M20 family peptidase [Microbulbifer sp. JSM ZJ756]|uniref:M20 family peptidase n=1 Tax=Microbulbifer sp. JSM ZJ756 TaxID=3376191 RepID=UPI0037A3AFF7